MQRLLRKVGRLSKSKHETTYSGGESRVIVGGTPTASVDPDGAREDEKTPSSCVPFANGTTRKCEEIPTTDEALNSSSKSSSRGKKKRNSLIESFRKLKRHSRRKDTRTRPVPGIDETVPPKGNDEEVRPPMGNDEAIRPETVAVVVCSESEPAAAAVDDHCPSTREVSVNGDLPSLSLSVLTLRSLGSAEASTAHTFSRLDTSSEVVENIRSDIGRAEFLAKEVPGPVEDASVPSTTGNLSQNQVSPEFNSISISPPPVLTWQNADPSSSVSFSAEKPTERQSSSLLRTECTVNLSCQLPTRVLANSTIFERGDHDDDDLGEDGNRIHDTLPVDLLYSPIQLGNVRSRPDNTGESSERAVASYRTSTLALTHQEDNSSSFTGNGKWSLMHELTQLSRHGWYWGPISREEAEEKLTDQPEGAFLIRDSTDERYLFSLSFRSFNRTLHTRIEYCNGEFSFYHLPHSEGYRSLVDLIENAIHDSLNGIFYYSRSNVAGSHSYAVKLTKPVSRFTHVRSLQYLCRFIIRQHTRVDHIQNLPLPVIVKSWLQENQY